MEWWWKTQRAVLCPWLQRWHSHISVSSLSLCGLHTPEVQQIQFPWPPASSSQTYLPSSPANRSSLPPALPPTPQAYFVEQKEEADWVSLLYRPGFCVPVSRPVASDSAGVRLLSASSVQSRSFTATNGSSQLNILFYSPIFYMFSCWNKASQSWFCSVHDELQPVATQASIYLRMWKPHRVQLSVISSFVCSLSASQIWFHRTLSVKLVSFSCISFSWTLFPGSSALPLEMCQT